LEKISREKFIRLGTALGVGAAGASLAACGGGASSGGGSGGKESDSGGGYGGGNSGDQGGKSSDKKSSEKGSKAASSSNEAAIAAESDVAPGSAVTFKDAGSPAVLVHLDNGDFVAYSAVCTHQSCTVAYKNGQLACPCHGSVFDPADGAAVVAGPAPRPLAEIPVKVEGGDIVKA
jgi:cytochrome b6-f complex iron-sulfur subunit